MSTHLLYAASVSQNDDISGSGNNANQHVANITRRRGNRREGMANTNESDNVVSQNRAKRRTNTPHYKKGITRHIPIKPLYEEEEDGDDYNFRPPKPPISVGGIRKQERESNVDDEEHTTESFGTINGDWSGNGGKVGNPEIESKTPYNSAYDVPDVAYQYAGGGGPSQQFNTDDMGDKMNYMIHMLETQKDIKTGHVTEELVLYSFVGVFVIFVVDSFARAGKYVR